MGAENSKESHRLPQVVGVTGFKRSGKDTFARVLVERAGYVRVGFADALKRDVAAWLGISVKELEERKAEFRATMQCYGSRMRNVNPQYWIRKLIVETIISMPKDTMFVISDVRYPNEAKWVRSVGGIIVRQIRAGRLGSEDTHSSETEVAQIEADAIVDVDSVEARELAAEDFLRE